MSCQCYKIGGPFIAEDPDCPAHGIDGCEKKLEKAELRIIELENAIKNEIFRLSLTSVPKKLEFMRQCGMKDLDEVHNWMRDVVLTLHKVIEN
jgi:hypothetical protein